MVWPASVQVDTVTISDMPMPWTPRQVSKCGGSRYKSLIEAYLDNPNLIEANLKNYTPFVYSEKVAWMSVVSTPNMIWVAFG